MKETPQLAAWAKRNNTRGRAIIELLADAPDDALSTYDVSTPGLDVLVLVARHPEAKRALKAWVRDNMEHGAPAPTILKG